MIINVIQLHNPSNLPLEVGYIIRNDLLGYPISVDDVILYEPSHMLGFQHGVGGYFHLLGEVVNYH